MNTVYRALRALPFRRGPKRWLGGICAGIAERFGWDPQLVRLITLLACLLPVIGVGLYLALWLLIPFADDSLPLERIVRAFRSR